MSEIQFGNDDDNSSILMPDRREMNLIEDSFLLFRFERRTYHVEKLYLAKGVLTRGNPEHCVLSDGNLQPSIVVLALVTFDNRRQYCRRIQDPQKWPCCHQPWTLHPGRCPFLGSKF